MSVTQPLISVIVVNDQIPVCKLWQQIIDKTPGMTCPGYAIDGEQAIELVHKSQPDVVLMDVLMPGMRGDEAMNHIREDYPDTIVIMYSADQSTEPIARASNADEFLLMPVPPRILLQTIRTIYRQKHDSS